MRRALADLERQGLVEKRQGIGTFASHSLPPVRLQANIGFISMNTLTGISIVHDGRG